MSWAAFSSTCLHVCIYCGQTGHCWLQSRPHCAADLNCLSFVLRNIVRMSRLQVFMSRLLIIMALRTAAPHREVWSQLHVHTCLQCLDQPQHSQSWSQITLEPCVRPGTVDYLQHDSVLMHAQWAKHLWFGESRVRAQRSHRSASVRHGTAMLCSSYMLYSSQSDGTRSNLEFFQLHSMFPHPSTPQYVPTSKPRRVSRSQ